MSSFKAPYNKNMTEQLCFYFHIQINLKQRKYICKLDLLENQISSKLHTIKT